MHDATLSDFLAEVVLTSHYLAEPARKTTGELSDAEMRCLRIIASFEPLSMQEIAEKLHATKPRSTQLVALLEAHDMVERTVASDRRRIDVSTTPAGREAIATLKERYDKLAMAIEKKLGKTDAAKLRELLAQITPLTRLDLD
jgi:DNA-binding MarR family transcriptional regulator